MNPLAAGQLPQVRAGRRCLVVLAGIPGAGKSTVLGRIQADAEITKLDSEQVRVVLRRVLPVRLPYRCYRPLVHLLHRTRIAWFCLTTTGPVVAHEPATRATTRAMLLLFGHLTGRRCVLLWLHADPEAALSGQRDRGRLIRARSFQRHVKRAERLHGRMLAGRMPAGWRSVWLFTREQAGAGIRLRT